MARVTIRNLSPETIERLRRRAEQRGCSLETLARSILDRAAADLTEFPHDLIAVVEPGEDIEPFLDSHDGPQATVDLP